MRTECRFCGNPCGSRRILVSIGGGFDAPRQVTSDATVCGQDDCVRKLENEFIEIMKRYDPKA